MSTGLHFVCLVIQDREHWQSCRAKQRSVICAALTGVDIKIKFRIEVKFRNCKKSEEQEDLTEFEETVT